MKYYGGVDGGGTSTRALIVDENGKKISECESGGSNVMHHGLDKVVDLTYNLIEEAKLQGLIDPNTRLESLGLCLSGAESDEIKEQVKKQMLLKYPGCAKIVEVENDLIGSGLACVGKNSTVHILISGTGSNSGVLMNGKMVSNTGGLGYLLGERGSAYWLASKAIDIIIRSIDGFDCKYDQEYDLNPLKSTSKEFFNYKTLPELIDLVYPNFKAEKIASFTYHIAKLAERGDLLAIKLFSTLAKDLVKYFRANLIKLKTSLKSEVNQVTILCIGSVWNSWNLFKNTFILEMKKIDQIKAFKLIKLKKHAAIGAVILALPVEMNHNFDYDIIVIYDSNLS